jgi:RNA polymerase sigma factor (sigma-70 family)
VGAPDPGPLLPRYVYGILRNLALQRKVAEGRRRKFIGTSIDEVEQAKLGTVEPHEEYVDELFKRERRHRLREAIADLPADEQELLIMIRSRDLTQRQAADELGLTPKQVSRMYGRARARLQDALGIKIDAPSEVRGGVR